MYHKIGARRHEKGYFYHEYESIIEEFWITSKGYCMIETLTHIKYAVYRLILMTKNKNWI